MQVRQWFRMRDHRAGSQHYGLRHADGSPKPAFAAFHAVPSCSWRGRGGPLPGPDAGTAACQAA